MVIDGVDQGQVDLYSAAAQWQVVESYSNLPEGQHTIQIKALGQKNPASGGTNVPVDAFSGPITMP